MRSVADKRQTFRALHKSGCFILPNPWDAGSARYLQHLGFKALATTSAGFAFSRGLPDYGVPLEVMLAHIRELVEGVDIPVNADFENGYADDPAGVAENVGRCVESGVAGLSIEDSTGEKSNPLYDSDYACERIKAARSTIGDAILVARTECFLVGRNDIAEVTRRLCAFSDAGADCLYAPGVREREHIAQLVKAIAPKPLNVLISAPGDLTTSDATALGVRRISVGGALARVAWGGFMRAARELAERGTFEGFAGAAPHGELDEFFRQQRLTTSR